MAGNTETIDPTRSVPCGEGECHACRSDYCKCPCHQEDTERETLADRVQDAIRDAWVEGAEAHKLATYDASEARQKAVEFDAALRGSAPPTGPSVSENLIAYCDARIEKLLVARDKAKEAGRVGVERCRQSDIETLLEVREVVLAETARAAAAEQPRTVESLIAVEAMAQKHAHRWLDMSDAYWLQRLIQEVGELASVMAGDHDDTMQHELTQIASIAVNWLRRLADAPEGSAAPRTPAPSGDAERLVALLRAWHEADDRQDGSFADADQDLKDFAVELFGQGERTTNRNEGEG